MVVGPIVTSWVIRTLRLHRRGHGGDDGDLDRHPLEVFDWDEETTLLESPISKKRPLVALLASLGLTRLMHINRSAGAYVVSARTNDETPLAGSAAEASDPVDSDPDPAYVILALSPH